MEDPISRNIGKIALVFVVGGLLFMTVMGILAANSHAKPLPQDPDEPNYEFSK